MSETTAQDKFTVDPRHTARAMALQQLFNYYASLKNQDSDTGSFTLEELMEIYRQKECDEDMYERIVSGVKENQEKMDKIIETLAPAWPIDQISLIDLVIMRMGIWEAFVSKHVPEKVAIDEAIELAKEFTGETSAKFVNGVLGNLLNREDLLETLQG